MCIFRKAFEPSRGLVILGSVDGEGMKALDVSGKIRVTIDVKR
ncbi:hypothetical protein [Akkermansia sp. EB-AMDK43]